jgi:hypothetical protein
MAKSASKSPFNAGTRSMTSRVLLRRALVVPVLLAALAACNDDDNGGGPGAGTFTLGAPATAELTMARGTATTVTIPVTFTGSFEPVTLTADSVPAGVRVGFQPSVITNAYEQVTVSITVNPDAVIGTNPIKIVARAEDMTDQVARISLTTTGLPSYTLASTATTTPVPIQRTQSGQVTVNITRNGFTGPLTFVAEGLPAGVTVPMVSNVTGNTAVITVNTAANASANTITFTLRGTNPTIGDRTVSARVTIVAEPGVQIASPATFNTVPGIPRDLPVTVNREGGYTGPVTVTLTGLPTGVTAAPVTSDAGSTVNVPLTIASNAAAATTNITVTVTGTAIAAKTATTALRVQSTVLQSGVPVTDVSDARARNSVRIFTINVPAGATRLTATMSGSGSATEDGDLELYNNLAGDPLCGSYNAGNTETCTVDNPSAGTWYVVLWVWNPYSNVTLTATVTGGTAALVGQPVQMGEVKLPTTPTARRAHAK